MVETCDFLDTKKACRNPQGCSCKVIASQAARIAELEAQLAEVTREREDALTELGLVIMACPQGERSMPIHKTVSAMRARLSALEATPPAPKVTDEMVECAARALHREAFISDSTAAEEWEEYADQRRCMARAALTAALSGDAS